MRRVARVARAASACAAVARPRAPLSPGFRLAPAQIQHTQEGGPLPPADGEGAPPAASEPAATAGAKGGNGHGEKDNGYSVSAPVRGAARSKFEAFR